MYWGDASKWGQHNYAIMQPSRSWNLAETPLWSHNMLKEIPFALALKCYEWPNPYPWVFTFNLDKSKWYLASNLSSLAWCTRYGSCCYGVHGLHAAAKCDLDAWNVASTWDIGHPWKRARRKNIRRTRITRCRWLQVVFNACVPRHLILSKSSRIHTCQTDCPPSQSKAQTDWKVGIF